MFCFLFLRISSILILICSRSCSFRIGDTSTIGTEVLRSLDSVEMMKSLVTLSSSSSCVRTPEMTRISEKSLAIVSERRLLRL